MEQNTYSAEEVARLLTAEGYEITKRTVNYYAFEKNMFETLTGKKSFSVEQLDKLKGIMILKRYTTYTLGQIKKIIETYDLAEIKSRFIKEINELDENLSLSYFINSMSYPLSNERALLGNLDNLGLAQQDSLINSCVSEQTMDNRIVAQKLKGLNKIRNEDTQKVLKVTNDISLLLSQDVDKSKVKRILDFIKEIEKGD